MARLLLVLLVCILPLGLGWAGDAPAPQPDDEYADIDLPDLPAAPSGEDAGPIFDGVCTDRAGGAGIIHAYPDELSQQYAGANGAHRMKEALAVISVDCLAGHRFGSIHMKKAYRKDTDLAAWAQNYPQQGDLIGNWWFVTDKIGPNDPNFGIFETGPVNSDFQYVLDGCTKVGPQMYDQYSWVVSAMNNAQKLLIFLGLKDQSTYHEYTTAELYTMVKNTQGYNLDLNKVLEGRYWQSPSYTQTGNNLITGTVKIKGGVAIPIKLSLEVHQFTARVDYNNDRKVTADDDAAKDVPMEFWVNNNRGYAEEVRDDGTNDIPAGDADCLDDHANGVRDLIDFAPVSFVMDKGLMDMLNNRRDRFVVRAKYLSGDGRATFFPVSNVVVHGGDIGAVASCITNEATARYTIQRVNGLGFQSALFSGTSQASSFSYSTETWLLMEGTHAGSVELALEILDLTNGEVIEADRVKLQLKNIKDLLVTMNAATDVVDNEETLTSVGATPGRYASVEPTEGKQLADLKSGSSVILMIHGFNVDSDAADKWFAETYKRLYWTGYKGDFVGLHWDGAVGIIGDWFAPGNFNGNIRHGFETGALLSYWMPTLTQNHRVTVLTHSAGVVVGLEALRLMALTNPGATKPVNLMTMEAASFQNVFSAPLPAIDGPGSFDNISHNSWFAPALNSITGSYYNLYSADDTVLDLMFCKANENGVNVNDSKLLGHALDSDMRRDLQLIQRDAFRLAMVIPGTHSYGADQFGIKCVIPHDTPALGNAACPSCTNNVDCKAEGYGLLLRSVGENHVIGCHSYLREKNYFDTYLTFRKISTVAQ